MKGKLIVIDGLDGSGKQTQTKLLLERLIRENKNVISTSFPNYENKTGELVKLYLSGDFGYLNSVNAYQGSIPYAMDRYYSYVKDDWGKKYNEGYIVICDRYMTSNLIHQGPKLSDNELIPYIDWINDLEFNKLNIPKPDMVVYLDVPVEVSKKLMENRKNKFTNEDKKDIHEGNINYLKRCYEVVQKISKLQNWEKVNCSVTGEMRSLEEINDDIYEKVKNLI